VAFTDGIPDAINAQDVQFGRERIPELVRNSGASPAALMQAIETQLGQFVGGAAQFDDITLLAIKRNR